jgi:tetratricopeptide (TPR) repeat protein
MRPPTPAATIAFKSPNACNLCHPEHDAAWSDEWCRKWYKADYQVETLRRAELIDAARKLKWNRLPEMLAELRKKDGDEVYKASLVRLLSACEDDGKWPVLLALLHDPSPLVRSSAVVALGGRLTPETLRALVASAADESRLVRIRCASALAALRPESLQNARDRANLERATGEFMAAMKARPDDWASHASLGNYYMESGNFPAAAACFETATALEPRQIGPMVNASMAYSNLGRNDQAEQSLRRALKMEPNNAAANFNLGLLLGEEGRLPEAEQALRAALRADPQMAAAAYNLAVILGQKSVDDAIAWCQKAHQLRPGDPKYAHTLAFYLRQKGDIYESRRDFPAAAAVYRDALKLDQLPPPLRRELEAKVRALESQRPGG